AGEAAGRALRDAPAIECGADDASGVAGAFTAGKEARDSRALQRLEIAHHANRARRPRFDADDDRLAGCESFHHAAESLERRAEPRVQKAGQLGVKRRGADARAIARARQALRIAPGDEIR